MLDARLDRFVFFRRKIILQAPRVIHRFHEEDLLKDRLVSLCFFASFATAER